MDKIAEKNTYRTAEKNGWNDGVDAVRENLEPGDDINTWFRSGHLAPDEGLINACTQEQLAEVLGLTCDQIAARGEEWDRALSAYNRGFEAGARHEAEE